MQSYRALIWLWVGVLSLAAAGAATLQILGPPHHEARRDAPGNPSVLPASVAVPPAAPTELTAPEPNDGPASVSAASTSAAPSSAPSEPAVLPAPVTEDGPGAAPARSSRQRARASAHRRIVPFELPVAGGRFAESVAAPQPAPSPPNPAPAGRQQGGYIGVYATGPDGMRTFRSDP